MSSRSYTANLLWDRKQPAEEGERLNALMQDDTEPGAGGVTVDNEVALEIQHLKNWAGGMPLESKRMLPSVGGVSGLCDNHTKVSDEFLVVARQDEEATHLPDRARLRQGGDSLDLVAVHHHAFSRYDMAKVGD